MSSELLRNTADVLEKVAEYFDHEDQTRQAADQRTRQEAATSLNEKIASAMGEELPPEAIEKLMAADPSVVETVTKLAARQHDEPPESMGEGYNPGEDDRAVPLTKTAEQKEAVDQQSQSFADWIMS